MFARRLSQAAKCNALQRRCEIDPLSGTSCTSVDDYHMSLSRVEIGQHHFPDSNKNANKMDRMELTFYQRFQRGSKIFPKIWNRTNGLSNCFY